MTAADIRCTLCCISIALLSLLATAYAQPCARFYLQGLDSTTTFYPQLAGVYKLATGLLSILVHGYPVYQHELDKLFLYYNSSQSALMVGLLQSQGLLKVQKRYGVQISSDVDYSLSRLFDFSTWMQWDPRTRRFVENRNLMRMRLQCVDENFGFCSSGYLYPSSLYETAVVDVVGPKFAWREPVDFSKLYFRLLDNVFYNLRPVYEMVNEIENRTSEYRTTQRYLYHADGKWRVGAKIGSDFLITGIILELEGNAMRVEYENETAWKWLDFTLFSPTHTYRSAFGHLQCRRQLPDGTNCQTAGVTACDNGGTCRTDANGLSSCYCTTGYRGIQCEHRISECVTSVLRPTAGESSVFKGHVPYHEGRIMTVFCLSNDESQYSVCLNGSWQSTSKTECNFLTTTTTSATPYLTSTTYDPAYSESGVKHVSRDSVERIGTVIVILACVQLGFPFLCYCCIACCPSDEEQTDEDSFNDELKIETRKRKTSLQRTCSGFFYVCWWAWLAFVIVYFVWYGYVPLDGSTALSAAVIMAFVCLGVLYCYVFSESFCSHEYKYLTQLEKEDVTAGEQIAEMKAAKPTVVFRAECSHNETRTRTVHGSHGRTHMETYRERVQDAVIEEPFVYLDCYDNSARFSPPPSSHVTKVHVELAIEFADDDSKRVYEEAYEEFKSRHLSRGEFVEFSTKNDLPGFVKRLVVHGPDHDVPSWMSSNCFCLASCCCLTWPYRLMFNSSVSSYSYRIVKKISARAVPVVNQPQSLGDFQRPSEAAAVEPCAPPLPVIISDDMPSIPFAPSDQIPSVPPPSYDEFTANPGLFHSPKHALQESIPLSEMKS